MKDLTCHLYDLFADLLEYPTTAALQKSGLYIQHLRETDPVAAQSFEAFQGGTQERTLEQMEELFTRVFDMQPLCYPYVGYHLFGESYKRGAFMAQLNETYHQCGFIVEKELPDHISIVLRYLALDSEKRTEDFGWALLYDGLMPALKKMTVALKKHTENPYAELASALQTWLVSEAEAADAADMLAEKESNHA